MLTDGIDLIKGIRIKNGSIKIFKETDGRLILVIKKKSFFIKNTIKFYVIDQFEVGDDCIRKAKEQSKIICDIDECVKKCSVQEYVK